MSLENYFWRHGSHRGSKMHFFVHMCVGSTFLRFLGFLKFLRFLRFLRLLKLLSPGPLHIKHPMWRFCPHFRNRSLAASDPVLGKCKRLLKGSSGYGSHVSCLTQVSLACMLDNETWTPQMRVIPLDMCRSVGTSLACFILSAIVFL